MAKVVLAGGSGFLGQALAGRLAATGWEVVVLSRRPRPEAPFREVAWDGCAAGSWITELDGAQAIVNLAGRSISCVHTPENRREIDESRVAAVRALAEGSKRVARPPVAWIQCSATGFYGDAGDRLCDETAPSGNDFLAGVCRRWEEEFAAVARPGLRQVVLRLGVVLDASQGALPPLARLTRWFAGGATGSGQQYLSWIHREDVMAGFVAALSDSTLTGIYNLCAPTPVTNAEFMRSLRAGLGRPWAPPAPAWAIRLLAGPIMGVDPALALHGQRCVPRRLVDAGFQFAHPDLGPALRELLETK